MSRNGKVVMAMNIETARLVLVSVSEAHIGDIFENFNEQVIKYMVPTVAKDISETTAVVHKFIEQRQNATDYVYAINLKSTGEFLGIAGLHNLRESIPEIGLWTKLEAHGNHYGREAIGGIIDYAKSIGIKKLCYPVDRRNIASRKIAIFYGGIRVVDYKEVATSDGRVLEEEIYEIDL